MNEVLNSVWKDKVNPHVTTSKYEPWSSYMKLCEIQKWLRDVHNIIIEIYSINRLYNYNTLYNFKVNKVGIDAKTSWEEALEAGLLEALNLIKVDNTN